MRDHLKAFLAYLRGNRGASPHTVRADQGDLAQFLEFLPIDNGKRREDQRPEDCDVGAIRSFLAELYRTHRSRKTSARETRLGARVRAIPAPRGAD